MPNDKTVEAKQPDQQPKTVKPLTQREVRALVTEDFSAKAMIDIIDARFTEDEQDEMTAADATSVVIQLYKQSQEAGPTANFPVKIA